MLRVREILNDFKIKFDVIQEGYAPVSISVDNAQGGIDARKLAVERLGELMPGVVSDRALEAMVMNAQGFRAVIVGITPITNLRALFGK